ncbi:MAG: polysaccharide biosynthesis/export family protein [Verrucomicrobiota bacterium]
MALFKQVGAGGWWWRGAGVGWLWLALFGLGLGAAEPAAGSGAGIVDRLNVGDKIRVVYKDIPNPPPPTEQLIPESGKLVLHLQQEFTFAGRKFDELEKEIREAYIQKGLYRNIGISIELLPRPVSVSGEVRAPGTIAHQGQMTVLKAIAAAGDFTEFAKKTKVRIDRLNGETIIVDCKKARRDPSKDVMVYPGDKIHVDRSIL